ncbi:hypothetical protein BN7_3537a [Wickerhamomyces ciferrii]|uniref:F-box domain-containing protein n=1 Tax=Wickerhamomyces ciferrii (strain ATCC 14091 / BCRC 22168 / CBS 111 / JCM 3599 / NBRC 0793 / NRRL Y-1031 F-60-10) TaxID=1206466 RepID=K0KP61_WICCF|nr:uncharacterized protein BN7_3537a [Wickerhamomyces ciferrii]CCH43982.1 hypothetical protein BN7_3537a [Wickerhamomyces ciferrii]
MLFEDLPIDILQTIQFFLNQKSIISLAQTCHALKDSCYETLYSKIYFIISIHDRQREIVELLGHYASGYKLKFDSSLRSKKSDPESELTNQSYNKGITVISGLLKFNKFLALTLDTLIEGNYIKKIYLDWVCFEKILDPFILDHFRINDYGYSITGDVELEKYGWNHKKIDIPSSDSFPFHNLFSSRRFIHLVYISKRLKNLDLMGQEFSNINEYLEEAATLSNNFFCLPINEFKDYKAALSYKIIYLNILELFDKTIKHQNNLNLLDFRIYFAGDLFIKSLNGNNTSYGTMQKLYINNTHRYHF